MSLQIKYSKEIAKELGKIAVYLPGEALEVGDIITFPYGKTSLFLRDTPLGSFKKISSLNELEVSYNKPKSSVSTHSYKFSSNISVNNTSSVNSEINILNSNLPNTTGTIKLTFASEGSIYFHALNCIKKQLGNISSLENEIITKSKILIWDNTYLVTSVTYAQKALIVQSLSKNAEITFEGNVNGIHASNTNIDASSEMMIKNQSGDFFIKDWSENVSVFMELMKFEKKIFGAEISRNLKVNDKQYRLIPVDINKLINNQ